MTRATGRTSQIQRGDRKSWNLFVEQPDRGIARIAKQAADVTIPVVVVDAKMLEEGYFIARALGGNTLEPRPPANRTASFLLDQNLFNVVQTYAISPTHV
jgi:hypothetical protein